MTKKRFVQNTNLIMQDNEVYVVCADEHSADVVTTALNMLMEENEQLTKKNNNLEKRLEALDDAFMEFEEKLYLEVFDIKLTEEDKKAVCEFSNLFFGGLLNKNDDME